MPQDYEYEHVPKCPHCGHEDRDWWDGHDSRREDWEASCPRCGGDYFVSMYVSTSFSTTVKKG